MQPTAHSSVSSEPEGRRSTKGRSLWRSGWSCDDYDHDHVFDDWPRGGDYGDQVDPVGADDRDDHDDVFFWWWCWSSWSVCILHVYLCVYLYTLPILKLLMERKRKNWSELYQLLASLLLVGKSSFSLLPSLFCHHDRHFDQACQNLQSYKYLVFEVSTVFVCFYFWVASHCWLGFRPCSHHDRQSEIGRLWNLQFQILSSAQCNYYEFWLWICLCLCFLFGAPRCSSSTCESGGKPKSRAGTLSIKRRKSSTSPKSLSSPMIKPLLVVLCQGTMYFRSLIPCAISRFFSVQFSYGKAEGGLDKGSVGDVTKPRSGASRWRSPPCRRRRRSRRRRKRRRRRRPRLARLSCLWRLPLCGGGGHAALSQLPGNVHNYRNQSSDLAAACLSGFWEIFTMEVQLRAFWRLVGPDKS